MAYRSEHNFIDAAIERIMMHISPPPPLQFIKKTVPKTNTLTILPGTLVVEIWHYEEFDEPIKKAIQIILPVESE